MRDRPVLPARFYGDPADVCDELRRMEAFAVVFREQTIRKNRRRIRALVAKAKKGKVKRR